MYNFATIIFVIVQIIPKIIIQDKNLAAILVAISILGVLPKSDCFIF